LTQVKERLFDFELNESW